MHRSLLDFAFNARSEVEWAKYREKTTDRSNGTEKKLSRRERLKAVTGSSTRKKAKVESTKKRKAEGPVSSAVQKQARVTDSLSTECQGVQLLMTPGHLHLNDK